MNSMLDLLFGFLFFSAAGLLSLLLTTVLLIILVAVFVLPLSETQANGDRMLNFFGGNKTASVFGIFLLLACNSVFGYLTVQTIHYFVELLQKVGEALS